MDFTWDNQKAARNLRKHGVSFEEAATAFDDPTGKYYHDPDHSDDEDRYLLLGFSDRGRLLMVCHTDRSDSIRIINARLATTHERRRYSNVRPR